MRRHALIPLCMLFLAACGDSEDSPVAPEETPVAPDEDLVGTWVFDSTDMVDVLAEGLEESLRDAGLDQDEIDQLLTEFRADVGGDISGLRTTIRFNADGSFEDDQGNSGTWRVDGNTLTMVEDGDEERAKYFVDGNDLTVIFPWGWLLDAFRDDEDITDEEVEALEEIFGLDEDINIRLFYMRK